MSRLENSETWPFFAYEDFKPTAHLLHMLMQMLGKLKLITPFEPEWSNVSLWITCEGITTGLIPYAQGGFSVSVNLITHQVICSSHTGKKIVFNLKTMSVAQLNKILLDALNKLNINIVINPKPQEVPDPILFHEDTDRSDYIPSLTHDWWRILVNTQRVMLRYHALFRGKTPSIALMWGTLDIREVRFNGKQVKPTSINSGFLRRNAMDEEQIEAGWWGGNTLFPQAAFYSFTYPEPEKLGQAEVFPTKASWNKSLSEFILVYDDVYQAKDPDSELLAFFESTYRAGAERANWDPQLIGLGKPI